MVDVRSDAGMSLVVDQSSGSAVSSQHHMLPSSLRGGCECQHRDLVYRPQREHQLRQLNQADASCIMCSSDYATHSNYYLQVNRRVEQQAVLHFSRHRQQLQLRLQLQGVVWWGAAGRPP